MLKSKGLISLIQREILGIFSKLPDQDQFYLTGGTALAEFYLEHRLSFDLDFFTGLERLIVPFSYELEKLYNQNGFRVLVNRRFNTFAEFTLIKGGEEVRIDLTLDSPFRFEKPIISEYDILINSYKDLIVDKLLAYYGRFEPRDAVDLYFILKSENLDNLLDSAAKKDAGFKLYWFAVALKQADDFPDELKNWPVKMLMKFEVRELKKLFREISDKALNKIFEKGEPDERI